MLEREIISQIRNYLKTVSDCYYFKNHGGAFGQGGLPDLCLCLGGRFIALEVKTERGKTTVLQQMTLNKIRKAGGVAEVVRSVDDVIKTIESL